MEAGVGDGGAFEDTCCVQVVGGCWHRRCSGQSAPRWPWCKRPRSPRTPVKVAAAGETVILLHLPSPSSRRLNSDGEGVSSKMTELSPTKALPSGRPVCRPHRRCRCRRPTAQPVRAAGPWPCWGALQRCVYMYSWQAVYCCGRKTAACQLFHALLLAGAAAAAAYI